MPHRPASPCSWPSCPNLKPCPDHRRPTAAARGYDRRWGATRAAYLRTHPTCEQAGCHTAAVDVHHLDGLGPNGPKGHAASNLQALCKRHHAGITARMQPGGWHQ
jgi:5-methylcytosine-specific restriction enzyme A